MAQVDALANVKLKHGLAWKEPCCGGIHDGWPSSPTDTATATDWKREDACGGGVHGSVGTCFGGRKTLVTVEFISVVPEMWSFGMLLAELYWSFDINMGEHPTKFRETIPKLRVGQRLEGSGM